MQGASGRLRRAGSWRFGQTRPVRKADACGQKIQASRIAVIQGKTSSEAKGFSSPTARANPRASALEGGLADISLSLGVPACNPLLRRAARGGARPDHTLCFGQGARQSSSPVTWS